MKRVLTCEIWVAEMPGTSTDRPACLTGSGAEWSLLSRSWRARVSKIYGSAPCKAAATTPPIHHCPFADSAVVFVYLNCRFSPKEINTSEFKALRRQNAKRWTARRETARASDISLRRCTRWPLTPELPNKTRRRLREQNGNLLHHEVGGLKNQHCFAGWWIRQRAKWDSSDYAYCSGRAKSQIKPSARVYVAAEVLNLSRPGRLDKSAVWKMSVNDTSHVVIHARGFYLRRCRCYI